MNLTKPQKLMKAGRYAEAEAALPPPGASKDARIEIIRARIKADSGDIAKAVSTLTALVDAQPGHAPAHLFRGIYQWDAGSPGEALESFNRTLQIQPDNNLATSYRALCLCATNRIDLAAEIWAQYGFSDNTMFRVRTAEFVESAWLYDRAFMGEPATHPNVNPAAKPSARKALRLFYRRNFSKMLDHLPPPGTANELEIFLAATAHEMLRHYDLAGEYLQPLMQRRDQWPEPLISLNARLMVRRGEIADAAREFATIVIMGPEDLGVNYYMGIVCLAFDKRAEARQYFLRAFTSYMVDTFEFQWWQLEQTLLETRDQSIAADTSA